MLPDSNFTRLNTAEPQVGFFFENEALIAREGDTVAAALLAAGIASLRETPVTRSERGPYCLMGVCFECLVAIDGVPNQQACMIPVREGVRVSRMHGARQTHDPTD